MLSSPSLTPAIVTVAALESRSPLPDCNRRLLHLIVTGYCIGISEVGPEFALHCLRGWRRIRACWDSIQACWKRAGVPSDRAVISSDHHALFSADGPSNVCNGQFWTLVDAVKAGAGSAAKVVTTAGVPTVLSDDTSGIPAAVEMAKAADVVVLAVGTDLSWAAEGHDANSIDFTDAQTKLIAQVCFSGT